MILGDSITLTPAFGRDYRSAGQATEHWAAGKDFRIGTDGPYCSIRDARSLHARGVRTIRIRYARLRNVVEIPLLLEELREEPRT
jgi:hypothetical protein